MGEYDLTIDKSKMYQAILDFPYHIKNSFDFFQNNSNIDKKTYEDIDSIMILGMGGSGITGLLISKLLKDNLNIPIYVNQSYSPDKSRVTSQTLVIACSYSGNTEETIEACSKCMNRTPKIIGLSTGGKLYKYLKKQKKDFIKLPIGLQPRAAIGYSFSLMLLLLNEIGALEQDAKIFNKDLTHSINPLIDCMEKYSVPDKNNPAYDLATKIYNKNPIIYAEDGIFNTIAYRFKCQLAENSKILAFNNSIPEMNHNEIEAFTNQVNKNCNFVIIWIRQTSMNPAYKKRINIVNKIFENKKIEQYDLIIKSRNENKVEECLTAINLVDWISYHCAILNKVDPSIIPNINELKKSL